ncbi:DEAD/DEAH box helicase [Actinomycetospora sp. CA-084318]|uniref:DEAD/DEAH box helicase n=1 Tax=Actinomycetospora sp. CA-084318 TaxID=3239892 RepID=UPI003D96F6DC
MDAFTVRDEVLDDYARFVRSFLTIKDPQIEDQVAREIADGLLWPEPWLGLNPAFAPGGTVSELVDEGVLDRRCLDIFRARTSPTDLGRELAFHRHQADAFRLAREQQSYVLTTGTGSGKSLSYIVPIVDRVLREGSGRGVRAVVVYPMNALANSQLGELEKFLGTTRQAVTFARYTGQENKAAREELLRKKPDILLTNYMMLELMLTRPYERRELISSAENLSFLVLDELHTYRGRQGADVAMLVRRLRGAVAGGRDLQCIGTSATLAGPGTDLEQRNEVARLANRIFGTEIGPDNVVGETLQRATQGIPTTDQLRQRVTDGPPGDFEALRTDPLASWVETTFGLEPREGRLVRRKPIRLGQAARDLHETTGVDEAVAREAIRKTLLTGSEVRDRAGRSLFAFKLHQFIGKGDTAYVTLEPPASRHLTTQYQRSAPGEPRGRPLFPLSFCRECGQEYLAVVRTRETLAPRTTGPGAQPAIGTPGLLLLLDADWPSDDAALLDLVPDEWILDDAGPRRLVDDRRKRLPEAVRIDPFGTIGTVGVPAAFFETLHFCPGCRTNYESTQQSEFSRVATLGTEGRASAVSVLSQAVVRILRAQQDLDDVARKFLAFSDNRQDASLQAGHFNDFVLVALMRSALFAAVREQQEKDPDEPLTDDVLAARVVDRLQVEPHEYAQEPDATPAVAKLTTKALRSVVAHLVWADLRRGWRITMPNLEQTGQLTLTYLGLPELAADDAAWAGAGEPLAGADAATREQLMQVLLDELRRNLCVATEHLTEEKYESTRSAAAQRLTASWQLTSDQGTYAAVGYPAPRPKGGAPGAGSDLFLSGLGLYGKWLRRPQRFPQHRQPLKPADAMGIIEYLMTRLEKAGLLERIAVRNRPVGYQIKADVIEWRAGTGGRRAEDPLRGARGEGRVNEYFARLYGETAGSLSGLVAREHTAQVPPEKREEREKEFGDARLPVLYCSPTMELGVDIKSLNVVGMRNVPPTPANYAQRSGRAGRSGQPAVVLTYCARGNAHDAYYFGRSQDMVAGVVSPPRLELGNEDLVRAHAHAVWLVHTGLDLKASMVELLDIDEPGQPLRAEVLTATRNGRAAEDAARHVQSLLAATPEVSEAPWWRDDWVEAVVREAPQRFDGAVGRWRGLYAEAQRELDNAGAVLKEIGASEPAKRRAKAQQNEARAALDLLKGQIDDVNQGDFYPYRYFASEGFLPGYSFPRLPLAAFIPGERRTRNGGEGDYVQRPRFLAISEFGPNAFIYHEGSRYEVTRVSLPANDDGTGVRLTSFWRCLRCGYLNDGNGPTGSVQCEQCESTELREMQSQMRLLAVRTRRRDRISADEEERQRAGYELLTSIRFEPRGQRGSQLRASIPGLATLAYGDTALIRRMNVGLRRRKDPDVHGYRLDTVEGQWLSETRAAGLDPQRAPRVVPYVEDHRNALVLELDRRFPADQRMAAMYALKRAVEARYELESSELAAEPMPARDGDHAWEYLLFFEAAEGGAGVLRRLATEPDELPAVARRAIELLHYDPDTGVDLGKAEHATEECAQACYDCLLSYGNQWDHQALDRHAVVPLLAELADAALTPRGDDGDAHDDELYARSNGLERQFLDLLREHGFRPPDDAQRLVDGYYVRPDFTYHVNGLDAAIFIDGPVHDEARQAEKDRAAGERLEDELGWLVLRFRYDDPDWTVRMREFESVFGRGRR